MKTLNLFLTSMAAMLCAASCQQSDEGDAPSAANERHDIALTKSEETLAKAGNGFAFELLRTVAGADSASDHVFLSPLSAGLAFGMLSNGAAGDTFDEISRTLGFGEASADVINDYYLKMLTELKAADKTVVLESANSIWVTNNFPVLDAFIQVNREKYEAEVRNEDFTDPATLALINAWCADKTHGKIKSILDNFPANAMVCLLNALYFKGTWSKPFFDKSETNDDATFTNDDGSPSLVSMMHSKLKANYAAGPGFELLELPYGNGAFGMVLLLPAEGSSARQVAASLDEAVWNDCLSQLSQRDINLSLPRFSLEYEIKLNDVLTAMGMPTVFDENKADFSRINPDVHLYLSLVKQKTTLDVNEEGTEAAAVTTVVLEKASFSPPVSLTFNRPFLFFIKEKSTGLILFAGLANKL